MSYWVSCIINKENTEAILSGLKIEGITQIIDAVRLAIFTNFKISVFKLQKKDDTLTPQQAYFIEETIPRPYYLFGVDVSAEESDLEIYNFMEDTMKMSVLKKFVTNDELYEYFKDLAPKGGARSRCRKYKKKGKKTLHKKKARKSHHVRKSRKSRRRRRH